MKITAVKLQHTNPSMGPHERIITFTMSNKEEHQEQFEQLLQGTTVNENYSLIDFLTADQARDEDTIKKIINTYTPAYLNEGQTISNFTITLEHGTEVLFSDLRTIQLGGYYSTFIPYLVKEGYRDERSNGSFKMPEPIPLPDESLPLFKTSLLEEDKGDHLTDS